MQKCQTKILNILGHLIITSFSVKYSIKRKKKGSVDKSDISRFINDSDLANEYSRHYSG